MWLRLVPMLLVACWLVPARADYLDELQQLARNKGLAQTPSWHNLLHYKRQPLTGRLRSLADDSGFFNAPDGNTDAQAELDATLAAFFSTAEESERQQNPQCRFIARFRWLDEQLGFDVRMPRQPCRRYEEWRAAMNPAGLTLIFPTGYLNSPASMYGHTMFRVDALGQTEQTRLLAYTISYAAAGNAGDGITFAVKGLTGLYPGAFATMPYYLKVSEYNDIENRDVWEYELNLTQAEIERVLQHVWELGPTRFDYYFFDENCAYHLLSLLDVARPALALTDRFVWHAIPSDTVRAVVDTPGLLRQVRYRPSNASLIGARATRLPRAALRQVERLAHGQESPAAPELAALPATQRAEVLELADLYLTYLQPSLTLGEREFQSRSRQLLLARSREPALELPSPPTPAVRPEQGHFSGRLQLAVGTMHGQAAGELRLRPAYHDLLDAEAGFTRGAELQFFELALRQTARQGGRLQSFTPVDIQSLTPSSALLGGKSWRVQFGLARHAAAQGGEPLVTQFSGGPGMAWDWQRRVLSYVFADNQLLVGKRLDDGYALGLGVSGGCLIDLSAAWRIQLQAASMRYWAGERQTRSLLELNQRWVWSRNQALRLEASVQHDEHGEKRNLLAGWSGYF